ncbi:NUDIX hydrolase [Bacillus pseudomycoides]|uniref:NUDIX hydrolase n=1 Tax=Bacillus pseudomycoides TaxID=64104 RepID=UPI001FB4D0D4|nr:NUDIX hydrolase [Bacillus pseudomycoides]
MKRWIGTAAICVNEKNEILMVLQGKKEEPKRWSVPSGGQEEGETLEECCIREVWEETGYEVKIINKIYEKKGVTYGVPVHVHYYLVKQIGGFMNIQDPDGLIHEIDWKNVNELRDLSLAFPEDYELLVRYINGTEKSGEIASEKMKER